MSWSTRILILAIAIPFLAWIAGGGLLFAVQDVLIYPAPDISRQTLDDNAARVGAVPFEIEASDGIRLYGWHIPQGGTRALIFFHGNGGTVEAAPWFAQQLPGWDVFCVAYRGYPGSDGSPSQAGLGLDARATWEHVTQTRGIPADHVVVQAQSLGGGVAHLLLETARPAGVVFDSTFLSVEHLAKPYAPIWPVSILLKSPFRSFQRAPNLTVPALVLHGDADTLIPVEHGRRHSALLPNASYIEIPGKGHGHWLLDDPKARGPWHAFLDSVVPAD